MQASLAALGTLAGLVHWYTGREPFWLAGALGSVIPVTLLVIKPVNDRLLAPGNDPGSPETLVLLRSWGHRHWIRSVASGVAFVCFLMALG